MQDAFVDNYHIQYAHPNTAGKHIHTNVQTVRTSAGTPGW